MSLADSMNSSPITCNPSASAEQTARLMTQNEVGAVIVVDEHRRPVGIVTDRDLVARVLATGRGSDTPVAEAMTGEPVTVASTNTLEDAVEQMGLRECRRLPVVDPETRCLVGIITLDDAMLSAVGQVEAIARVLSSERRPDADSVL